METISASSRFRQSASCLRHQPNRGRARLNLIFSVIAISAQIWAFAAVGDPLRGPQWAFGVMMFGLMLAIVALTLSVAYLVRLEDHRVSSGVSAALAAAAFLWPLSLMGG